MKNFISNLMLSIIAVFAPIHGMIITCVLLIMADMVSGVIAAHKRKEKISSANLRRTVSKFFIYLCALMLGFLVEKFLIDSILPVSKLIGTVIGLVELKSVLENLDSISGSNLFQNIISKLGSANQSDEK